MHIYVYVYVYICIYVFLFLSDNFISEIKREDLHSLGGSLKILDLSGNSLTSVPEAIFWDLQRLESLDLSRNNIIQIHSMAFQNGVRLTSAVIMLITRSSVAACKMITPNTTTFKEYNKILRSSNYSIHTFVLKGIITEQHN